MHSFVLHKVIMGLRDLGKMRKPASDSGNVPEFPAANKGVI